MRWRGFRKVRRQVCRRIARRMEELGCLDIGSYRAHLARHEEEWRVLDGLCRVTISRFYRDRQVFDALRTLVLPELARRARARGASGLRGWSAGCASGEEPYTLLLIWRLELGREFPGFPLMVVATDSDPLLLARAERACYSESSLRDLPPRWKDEAFSVSGEELCLDESFRAGVDFRLQDVRREHPEGPFDLILCRNLVFTYFEPALQRELQSKLADCLVPGGALVVGAHETTLPGDFEPWLERAGVYERVEPRSSTTARAHR
jgi:chemotaxis protein methyltransferase CheR